MMSVFASESLLHRPSSLASWVFVWGKMGISITSVRHESTKTRLTLHACDVARSKELGDFEMNCC